MKKYELTNETKEINGCTLHRIVALRDFGNVKKGYLGGFIEKESNLSHANTCWIYDDGIVCGESRLCEGSEVHDNAVVCGTSTIWENSRIFENAYVCDSLIGRSKIHGNASVNNAEVLCGAEVKDRVLIKGGRIESDVVIADNVTVSGNSYISGYNVTVGENASIVDGMVLSNDDWRVFGGYNDRYVTWLRKGDYFVLNGMKYTAYGLIEYAHKVGGYALANTISAIAGVEMLKSQKAKIQSRTKTFIAKKINFQAVSKLTL